MKYVWKWVGTDDPPASVVLKVESQASWTGPPGDCDDGLGQSDPKVDSYAGTTVVSQSQSGVKYLVKPVSEKMVKYSIAPSSHATAGTCNVSITIGLYPIDLSIGSTVLDEGTLYGEAGRLHNTILTTTAPGVTFENVRYNVSDNAFKLYFHDDGTVGSNAAGYVLYFSPQDLATSYYLPIYWKKSGMETISCTADAVYNYQPFGSISATKRVQIEQPDSRLDGACSENSRKVYWGLQSNGNPNLLDSAGDPTGIAYEFSLGHCDHFPPGIAYNAQLINANWTSDPGLPTEWKSTGGVYELDASYPYNERVSGSSSQVLFSESDSDAPGYAVIFHPTTVTVSTEFDIHLMYACDDFAEQDVPLRILYWSWNGNSSSSIISSPTKGVVGATSLHPEWNDVFHP